MRFKAYISEGVIVPPNLNIKTTDIKKLKKQFKGYITFKMSDGGAHASYIPENGNIVVYLDVDGDMTPEVLEALIQHEIIHSIQDKKSGKKMAKSIQDDFKKLKEYNDYIQDMDDDEEVDPKIIKAYQTLIAKMDFLNHEEEMTYSYMYAKMYKSLSPKEVIDKMTKEWVKWTDKKPSKRMMKYFGSYWMVRKDL